MKTFKEFVLTHKAKTLGFESQGDYYYGGMKIGRDAAMAECKLEIKQLKNQITNLKLKGATEAYYQMKGKENG